MENLEEVLFNVGDLIKLKRNNWDVPAGTIGVVIKNLPHYKRWRKIFFPNFGVLEIFNSNLERI